MHLAVLTLEFHLAGCSSLKEKRQRLGGLRDKFGKLANIAVCESNYLDNLQSAEWSFVLTGQNRAQIDTLRNKILKHIHTYTDARIMAEHLQHL